MVARGLRSSCETLSTRSRRLRSDDSARAFLQDILTDGLTSGVFRPLDARFSADVLNLVMMSISDGTLLERTGLNATEAMRELKELLFRGLLHSLGPAVARSSSITWSSLRECGRAISGMTSLQDMRRVSRT